MELYILSNLLKFSLASIGLILLVDILLSNFNVSYILTDSYIICALVVCYGLLKRKKYKSSVFLLTSAPLFAMYHRMLVHGESTIPLVAILTIGFGISILMRGRMKLFMHLLVVIGLILVLSVRIYSDHPRQEVLSLGFTFFVLYSLISISAGNLKYRYDTINKKLKCLNTELSEKAEKIEEQNKSLLRSQKKLNSLNGFLNQTVEERTNRLMEQNKHLLNYSFMNAHYVRGPVARIMGMINLSRIDANLEYSYVIEIIENEIKQIDSTISFINQQLEKVID